jgi:hypothetical protein
MRHMLSHNRTIRLLVDCKPEQVLPNRDQRIRLTSLGSSLWLLYYRIRRSSRICVRCRCGACKSPQSGSHRYNYVATISHL